MKANDLKQYVNFFVNSVYKLVVLLKFIVYLLSQNIKIEKFISTYLLRYLVLMFSSRHFTRNDFSINNNYPQEIANISSHFKQAG